MSSEDNDPMSATSAYNPTYQTNDFIEQNEHDAKEIQADWIASGHSGIAPAALAAFGNALHPITDAKSPAHDGFQKVNHVTIIWHVLREGLPYANLDRKRAAAAAARSAFFQVFGSELGSKATHEKVTSKIVDWKPLPDQQK